MIEVQDTVAGIGSVQPLASRSGDDLNLREPGSVAFVRRSRKSHTSDSVQIERNREVARGWRELELPGTEDFRPIRIKRPKSAGKEIEANGIRPESQHADLRDVHVFG